MSNRCPSCEKFVALEAGDPEVQSSEVDETGQVSVEVRFVLTCQDCGEEMKETTFNFDKVPDELENHLEAHREAGDKDVSLSLEEPSFEAEDRYEDKDRKGKKIKNYRYMKHMWGVRGEATVECSCGKSFSLELFDEVQASGMDELN